MCLTKRAVYKYCRHVDCFRTTRYADLCKCGTDGRGFCYKVQDSGEDIEVGDWCIGCEDLPVAEKQEFIDRYNAAVTAKASVVADSGHV